MKTITTADPEFADILRELGAQGEAIRKRRELSEDSFRLWLYSAIQDIAGRLGYTVQNALEFARDMADGFRSGFAEGRQRAKNSSIRAKRGSGGR